MSNWKKYKLGELANRNNGVVDGSFGSNLPASDYTPSGVPIIRGTNLSLGERKFYDDGFVFVSAQTARRLERSLCKRGDIIFTKKGTLGQIGIIPPNAKYDRYLLSSNQMRLTVDAELADKDFLYYYLSSKVMIDKIRRESESTGVPKINLGYIKQFEVEIPEDVAIQTRIAEILSALDDKIALARRSNQTLEDIAQTLFRKYFVDDIDPEQLPEGWRWGKLGEIVEVKGGGTPSTTVPEYWNGDVAWTTPKDLSGLRFPVLLSTEKKITGKGLGKISSGILPVGTLLLSSRAPIGYLAITQISVAINQGYIAILCNKGYSNLFMLFWLKENMDLILRNANGSTFMEINKATFRNIDVFIPPLSLAAKFQNLSGELFNQIVRNEKEIRTLSTLRDNLLPKLLSGELAVSPTLSLAAQSEHAIIL